MLPKYRRVPSVPFIHSWRCRCLEALSRCATVATLGELSDGSVLKPQLVHEHVEVV